MCEQEAAVKAERRLLAAVVCSLIEIDTPQPLSPSCSSISRHDKYGPGDACRLVSKFRRWLEGEGGGGPMAGAHLPPMERRKEVLLERWHSHTTQCKSCQKVGATQAARSPGGR